MSIPRHGELFAGISGFGAGFDDAGIETAWHVEIDPTCQSVLRRHYPDALLLSDVRECGKHNLPQVDVITFGSPCQDLSLAGKRKGLAGERSGLYFEAIRIIKELRPVIAVWENVPGALSSNSGRDFGAALDALADAGAVDIAWRVLDAQWFGVAQRRRRLFVVASFRDGTSAAEILFEPESCQRDTPPSRDAGQGITRTLTSSTGRSKFDPDRGLAVPQVAAANCSRIGKGSFTDPVNDNIIAHALGSRCPGERQEAEATYVVRTAQQGSNGWGVQEDVTHALDSTSASQVVAHCLRSEGTDASEDGTGRGVPIVVGSLTGTDGGYSPDRAATGQYIPVAFTQNQVGDVLTGDVCPAMGTNSNASGRNTPKVNQGMAVRRLMPIEAERLQGFPDDWTAYDDQGKPISDSARYRMLGNAVCTKVSAWIGKRIVAALAGKRERMDIEQKAIKAVANVAAQAYRRAFDVKPDMTTGALAVMVDAIAALDQPTPAPKADNEDVIWRAIGSLTQRVRDLEQPTPAPEPPTVGRRVSREEALHITKDVMDKAEQERQAQPAPTIQPEASQPLPTEVEAAYGTMWSEVVYEVPEGRITAAMSIMKFHDRLASLWPKAGQVPSVEEIRAWHWGTDKRTVDLIGYTVELQTKGAKDEREWLLSRMGQPAKPDKFDCDNCDVTDLRPAQPSPVTAEKLADLCICGHWKDIHTSGTTCKIIGCECKSFCSTTQATPAHSRMVKFLAAQQVVWLPPSLIPALAEAILQAFPTLGQGRLTVSKEQWERLDTYTSTPGLLLRSEVKAWLKDELGMEVADD